MENSFLLYGSTRTQYGTVVLYYYYFNLCITFYEAKLVTLTSGLTYEKGTRSSEVQGASLKMQLRGVSLVLAVAACGCAYFGPAWHFTAETQWTKLPVGTTVETAWAVIQDFDSYSKWNKFTVEVSTAQFPPQRGQPVTLRVLLDQPWPLSVFYSQKSNMTLDFRWLEFSPPHRLCWGIQNRLKLLDNVLHSHRCLELNKEPDGSISVRNQDLNTGILAPIVKIAYKKQIEAGFRIMNRNLKSEIQRRNLEANS